MTGPFPFNGPLPGGLHPERCRRCNALHPPGGHCLSCSFDSGLGRMFGCKACNGSGKNLFGGTCVECGGKKNPKAFVF